MNPLPIGIIGGAGPLAGAALLERVFTLSSSLYGCYRDADYPKIFFISFPFSEMLSQEIDIKKIKRELKDCLKQLRDNGAVVLAIACNTLHAFLEDDEDLTNLIHLPKILATEVSQVDTPLVLCTSTAVRFGIHKQFFSCEYPSSIVQEAIDRIINQILKGINKDIVVRELLEIIKKQRENTIILGCTELSLLSNQLGLINKRIIDPFEIVAQKILKRSFLQKGIKNVIYDEKFNGI